MKTWEGSELNRAKEILAFELTKMVHGEEEATKAQESARALFGAGSADSAPTVEVTAEDGSDVISLLVKTGLCSSRGDARRNIQQGGVTANDAKVTDPDKTFSEDELRAGVLLKRGKKNFFKVILK